MKILVLPGDGIGEEITQATMAVLKVADNRFSLGLEYDFMDIGFKALEKTGTTLPDAVLEAARKSDGPFTVGTLLAYFLLKNTEMRNIMTLLNGKNYNLSEERIRSALLF